MAYRKLLFTLLLSFLIMYGVMFLNVDNSSHIYLSATRTYMSLLMVSPMAILMILLMGKMYSNKKTNALFISGSVLVFTIVLFCLRSQQFVSDRNYLKAMIPHHSSAILTSKHAKLKDPEVEQLANQIIQSQEEEIRQMKAILKRME